MSVFAQINSMPKILWGNESNSNKLSLSEITASDETGIYTLFEKSNSRSKKSVIILEHFNRKMNQTKSVEINLTKDYDDRTFFCLYHLNNELYLLSTYNDESKRILSLYAQKVNKQTLIPEKNISLLTEQKYNGTRNTGFFSTSLSKDESKLLVYYKLYTSKYDTETFHLLVLDNNLSKIWDKEINLPYNEKLFIVQDFVVDNDANVHIVGKLFEDKLREEKKGEPNYQFNVMSYRNNGSDFQNYTIDIPGIFITDIMIAINSEDDIICGGYFSEERTSSIKGSYFLKINNETKKIENREFQEFSIDFLTEDMSEREEEKIKNKAAKGKDVELARYQLNEILLREDGGAILVGEQHYITTTTRTDANGMTYTTTNYHYNHIIVSNISTDGKIEWSRKIPKVQISSNDGGYYSSYALAAVDDEMHFIFNENPKNMSRAKGERIKNVIPKKAVVAIATLDISGLIKKKELYSLGSTDCIIIPTVSSQISKNELVLFGVNKKGNRFALLSF